jgi:hypothetical protein
VNDLDLVCTHEGGEARQVLYVVASAQRQHARVVEERQLGPQR